MSGEQMLQDAVTAGGGENLEVMLEAQNYNDWLRAKIRECGQGAGNVLDFGAGIGTFSNALALPVGNVHCVEPDEASRQVLEGKGFQTYRQSKDIASESIEFAFSLNVLEHIEDDGGTLKEIHRVMAPGATLFVYVPAFQILFTSMDRHVGHVRRYRRHQLCNVVEQAGFTVTKSSYADPLGFFATLAFRLFDSDQPKPLNPRSVAFYDRYLFPASRALSPLFALAFGKNTFVIARKSLIGEREC